MIIVISIPEYLKVHFLTSNVLLSKNVGISKEVTLGITKQCLIDDQITIVGAIAWKKVGCKPLSYRSSLADRVYSINYSYEPNVSLYRYDDSVITIDSPTIPLKWHFKHAAWTRFNWNGGRKQYHEVKLLCKRHWHKITLVVCSSWDFSVTNQFDSVHCWKHFAVILESSAWIIWPLDRHGPLHVHNKTYHSSSTHSRTRYCDCIYVCSLYLLCEETLITYENFRTVNHHFSLFYQMGCISQTWIDYNPSLDNHSIVNNNNQ